MSYLEIILGPMFSGKTSQLLTIYKTEKLSSRKVLVINYSLDTRYSDKDLSTHDKQMIKCRQTRLLRELYDIKSNRGVDLSLYDTILINEGQFFSDLYDWVTYVLSNYTVKIYICGLDGDFKRKKFGQILDLIPLCDKVCKLSAICAICKDGTPGIFSQRLSDEKTQTVIGSDNYIPVCRRCYEK